MFIHDMSRDDFIYAYDKPVYVRGYCRVRNDELEYVCQHYRSYPNS